MEPKHPSYIKQIAPFDWEKTLFQCPEVSLELTDSLKKLLKETAQELKGAATACQAQ